MYNDYFSLTKNPFSLIPNPEFLHMSSEHQMAYTMLEYGLYEQNGIVVLTGEVGSGKTLLLRHFLNQIKNQKVIVGLINNTHESLGDLTQWCALAFGIDIKGMDSCELFNAIQKYLIEQYSRGYRILLVVDEAQNLSSAGLEQLRLFTNINADNDFLLQILMIGQPELIEKLQKPQLAQIAQRVSVEYHIKPLNLENTKSYIEHRLHVAGSTTPCLFTDGAIKVIYCQSGGIPRLINTLCDYALVHAYAIQADKVDINTAFEASRGRKIGGINRFKILQTEMESLLDEIHEQLQ